MEQLLENTLLGGVMILTVAVLRRIFRGRLSPNVTLLLWAVCFARLMTPVPLAGPLSPYGAVVREAETAIMSDGHAAAAPEMTWAENPVTEPGALEENAVSAPALSLSDAVPAAWGAVAAVLAALTVWAWFRSRRRIRAVPLAGERPEGVLPARARLRVGRFPGAPLTFGVIWPDVVLTPELQGKEYMYVLAHEAAHVRRKDNLWHYASALAVCVHWFNPTVWLMAALIRRDVEISCDRAVIAGASEDIRAQYANTVINLSAVPRGAALASGFARRKTKERIVSIMKYKKTTLAGIVAAVLAVCAVAALAMTPVRAEKPERTEFILSREGAGNVQSGQLRYHMTRAWTAHDESRIPEGGFKPYCNVNLRLITGNEADPVTFWSEGGTPTFIHEDGSFDEDMYMIFVELEITNEDCSTEVIDETGPYTTGYLTDPYLFGGQYLLELTEAGNTGRTYEPSFYSFYGEGFDPEGLNIRGYNFADACLAFRLEPGETRTVTLGFIISNDRGVTPPEPSLIRARQVTGRPYGAELIPLPGITAAFDAPSEEGGNAATEVVGK